MVSPETVTVLPVPTLASEKAPVAEDTSRVTSSPVTTPTMDALPVFSVALAVPSYTLLEAVIPVTVNSFCVIFAVAVGWVSE